MKYSIFFRVKTENIIALNLNTSNTHQKYLEINFLSIVNLN